MSDDTVAAATIEGAARLLDELIAARARSEGVAYKLDAGFFAAHLRAGVRCFFGVKVEISPDTGRH
ncbi:MAG TPA: hypothetical protein VE907_19670 [Gammaproteobacteria bacterium]|nr:hypothetical protein [Gammaproteobacteria bacterium]